MADDRDARIAELEAEVAALREREADAVKRAHRAEAAQAESVERLAATGEVLRGIASSPTNLRHVLDAIAEMARRLSVVIQAVVQQPLGHQFSVAGRASGLPPGVQPSAPGPITRASGPARAFLD